MGDLKKKKRLHVELIRLVVCREKDGVHISGSYGHMFYSIGIEWQGMFFALAVPNSGSEFLTSAGGDGGKMRMWTG